MRVLFENETPEFFANTFSDLVTTYKAMDDFYPESDLIRGASERPTLQFLIRSIDDDTGSLPVHAFTVPEVLGMYKALKQRAAGPESWYRDNAQVLVDQIEQGFNELFAHTTHRIGAVAVAA